MHSGEASCSITFCLQLLKYYRKWYIETLKFLLSIGYCQREAKAIMQLNITNSLLKKNFFLQEIQAEPNLFRLLVGSLCPSIYGHELVKAGLLLCLFGGCGPGHKRAVGVRYNSHILVVGDPGLGKSQMLKACANVSPRGEQWIVRQIRATVFIVVLMIQLSLGLLTLLLASHRCIRVWQQHYYTRLDGDPEP